jgi:hypothetical protein
MPLNITFNGFLTDGADAQPYYYQAHFRKVNDASSASKWQDAPVQVGADGYFNFNLGDDDLLGVDGIAAPGDIVIIAAWEGDTVRTSLDLTRASWFAVTLTSADFYSKDISVIGTAEPTSELTGIPGNLARLTDMTPDNDSRMNSTAAGPGAFDNPVDSNQAQWYPESQTHTLEIFPCYEIEETTIQWTFGEVPTGEVIYDRTTYGGTPFEITRQYDSAPGSTHEIRAWAKNRLTVTDSTPYIDYINIVARTPTAGLDADIPTPSINDLVTFTPDITDPDSAVATVDYSIDGGLSWLHTDLGVAETWQHQFVTNGPRTIVQKIHWNDGFDDQETEGNFPITVVNLDPVAFYTAASERKNALTITWTDASQDEDGTIANYTWDLDRADGAGGWLYEADASGPGMTEFTYTFNTEDDYRLILTVIDNDGAEDNYETLFYVTITPVNPNPDGIPYPELIKIQGLYVESITPELTVESLSMTILPKGLDMLHPITEHLYRDATNMHDNMITWKINDGDSAPESPTRVALILTNTDDPTDIITIDSDTAPYDLAVPGDNETFRYDTITQALTIDLGGKAIASFPVALYTVALKWWDAVYTNGRTWGHQRKRIRIH